MLSDLVVRDLGVIEDLTLRFGPGMTAVTGETGAGKTLLVEALALVLGGRVTAGIVRHGATEALVEAVFVDGEEESALARAVPAEGRSRAWVDGRVAPARSLAEAAAGLVDIHGQHEHHALLTPRAQRQVLDSFAQVDLAPRRAARQAIEQIDRALDTLGGDPHALARDAEILARQVAEIDAAAIIGPGEDEELAAEESRLADVDAHRAAVSLALDCLDAEATGDGSGPSSVDLLLRDATESLGRREGFRAWHQRLDAARTELADLASELRAALDGAEDEAGRLGQIQTRRSLLTDLRRRYGNTLEEVLVFAKQAAERLSAIERSGEEATRLAEERRHAEETLAAAEEAIGAARRAAAPRLAAVVTERFGDLAMPAARLEVSVGDAPAGDDVAILLSANPGEPPQPLARIASGGELARTMLALRLVAVGGPPTMVFDEVDAGVGGVAALALARALQEVARDRQVLVVTHLPQVAAAADHHVRVEKAVTGGRTVTRTEVLDEDERRVEVSRMLSGHPDSETARAHADELLAALARQ